MGMYGYDESDEAVELFLFAQNDRDLYRQQTLPIIENLKKKITKGKYDKTLAVKLWRYLADNAAKKYTFEHGTTSARTWQTVKGFGVFTVAMRNGTARLLEDYYASEALGLRQENPKRRKRSTPIKRTNISKRKYVSRPSQITGEAPTRRLKKRRTLAQSGPAGYFPNPAKKIKNQPASLAGSGVAVYFDSEMGEYQVRIAGKPKATYFTDDKADALATAQHMRNTMLGTRRANPVKSASSKRPANFPFVVERKNTENWNTSSAFKTKGEAFEYAKALAKKYPSLPVRVMHYKGGPM